MGCDIHGWVEVQRYFGLWDACMDIRSVIGRNYGMFALLFGVRNGDKFVPVAPERGLPQNVSGRVQKECVAWGEDGHSSSYITLQEIKNIDWEGHGTTLSDYIDCYKPGETTPFVSFAMSTELSDRDYRLLAQGETITKGDITYRRNFSKMSDCKSDDWTLLISIMEQLQTFCDEDAKRYARDVDNVVESKPAVVPYVDTSRVRLVVWFDN